MLNTPSCNEHTVGEIIVENIKDLIRRLEETEKVYISLSDIQYELFSRVEYLAVKSKTIYPNEDLPEKFGIQRGYGGGGIHTSAIRTDISKMKKYRKKKAERVLNLFAICFWKILNDIDKAGGDVEDWEKLSL